VTVEVFDDDGNRADQGTGFFVSNDGAVVTSRHLFRRAAAATVVLADGKRHAADGVRGADPGNDLVVLAVAVPGATAVTWGASTALVAGTPVAMVGSPRDVAQTFTEGAFTRRKDALGIPFLETTAAMDHGGSGSPLFDPQGRVVGLGAARVDWENPSGLAIPVERVRALAESSRKANVRPFGTAATFLDAAEWAVQTSSEMAAATEAAAAGDASGLVAAMRVVVTKHPKSALALFGLAGAQSAAGNDGDAVAALRQALALSPLYFEAASDLAEALDRLGRVEEAQAAFRRALEIEPRSLSLRFGLGRSLVRTKSFAAAARHLEVVTGAQPDRADAWAWLGTAYLGAGRFDDARSVVERLRAEHPEAARRLAEQIDRKAK